jgi:Xaa-Pro aminopeptidase
VIVLMPGREHGEYVLFCRERNAERELWDGLRAGQEGAMRDFGADDAFPITDIDDILPGLIEGRDRVYSAMGSNPEFDRHLMDWINVIRSKAHLGAQPPNEFVALDHLLHDMRLYKSAAEVKVMREAARISARPMCAPCRPAAPVCTSSAWKPSWITSSARAARRCRPTAQSSRPDATAASCITSRMTRCSRTATWC